MPFGSAYPHQSVYDVRAYGAKGNNSADDWPAFKAALDAIDNLGDETVGAHLHIPTGVYRLSQSLTINRPMLITGDGGYHYSNNNTVLRFNDGVPGVIFSYYQEGVTAAANAAGSVLRDVYLIGHYTRTSSSGIPTLGSADGVIIYAPNVSVENVGITQFNRCGIYIPSDPVEDGYGVANTQPNLFHLHKVSMKDCGADGVEVVGIDSNAGLGLLVSVVECGGWGINDHSFLGNTWVQCHVRDNEGGAYRTNGGVNDSTLVGCYSESGGDPSVLTDGTTVVGGVHGAGIVGEAGSGPINAGYMQGAIMNTATSQWSTAPYTSLVRLFMGHGGVSRPVLQLQGGDDEEDPGPAIFLGDGPSGYTMYVAADFPNLGGVIGEPGGASPRFLVRPTFMAFSQAHASNDNLIVDNAHATPTGAIQRWRRTGTDKVIVHADGSVEITDATKGLILRSPDASRWRLTVGDDGQLDITEI